MKNRPGSAPDGLVRRSPNGSGPEASLCARIMGPGSGRTQPARYQFPPSRLGCVPPHHRRPGSYCEKPARTRFGSGCVSDFGQSDPARKRAGGQESSGPRLTNVAKPIRIGCESDPARLLGICMESGVFALTFSIYTFTAMVVTRLPAALQQYFYGDNDVLGLSPVPCNAAASRRSSPTLIEPMNQRAA